MYRNMNSTVGAASGSKEKFLFEGDFFMFSWTKKYFIQFLFSVAASLKKLLDYFFSFFFSNSKPVLA